MREALDTLPNKKIVTFHEAFPYFAKEFGLEIVAVIEREPGSEPGAGELADTIGIIKDLGVKALFAEPQYAPKAAETLAAETGATVYSLDPFVTGSEDDPADSYEIAMRKNLDVLKQALGSN
jgi:zinc transport system substrate-binding protein